MYTLRFPSGLLFVVNCTDAVLSVFLQHLNKPKPKNQYDHVKYRTHQNISTIISMKFVALTTNQTNTQNIIKTIISISFFFLSFYLKQWIIWINFNFNFKTNFEEDFHRFKLSPKNIHLFFSCIYFIFLNFSLVIFLFCWIFFGKKNYSNSTKRIE